MDILGERWTFLILRESFYGVRRFSDMQRNLGIARNILSARLQTLVGAGILERRHYQQEPERFEYRLTEQGRDLYPAIIAIMRWGDEHLSGDGPPWSCTTAAASRRPRARVRALREADAPARRHARRRASPPAALAFRGANRNRRTNEHSGHAPGAVGRGDHQGRRQLPGVGRARARRRRALARPHQGRRRASERRPRPAGRRARAAHRRRRGRDRRRASTTTSSRSTSSRRARARRAT